MRLMCEEDIAVAAPPPPQQHELVVELVGVVEDGRTKSFQLPGDHDDTLSRDEMPDMELCTDKVLSKGRILQELTKAVKLVYIQSLHGTVVLDGDSWLVYWLDRALRHGLRIERHGYWGTARELSHQDTVVVIHALQNVLTSIGKGRAWLYHTLSEGSFESYLACMLRDTKTLKKQYFPHALVRDVDNTNQLINLLAGLENVSFTLQLDVTYLDIVNYMPQRPMSGSPSGTALSLHLRSTSVCSSLASPGDSGIAFDSDMDAANETDTSSYKEEDWSSRKNMKYRNNRYKLVNNSNENKNFEFTSSDSGNENKTPKQSPVAATKFHNTAVTNSDIINQNLTSCKLDDNELNCSSLDTIKDYKYYSKSVDPSIEEANTDSENNGILITAYNKRPNYYGSDASYSFKKMLDPRNTYVINNDTNLLELSMTISDCDNTEAPYSILNTVNMTDTSILSSSSSDALVQRRRKKKRSETKKRVSFHEDIFKMMKLDDDENYVDYTMTYDPPDSLPKKDTQKGRYSWCAHGDSPYAQQKTPSTRNAYSDYYSSTSSLSFFDSDASGERKSASNSSSGCPEVAECACSLAERGTPEGQEDPGRTFRPKLEIELEDNEAQEAYIIEKAYGNVVEDPPVKLESPTSPNGKYISSSDWSDIDSVTTASDMTEDRRNSNTGSKSRHLVSPVKKRNITSIVSVDNNRLTVPPLRQAPSKTSLLSRFLRSITERKFDTKKDKKSATQSNPLLMKGAKIDQNAVKEFNDALEKEVQENVAASEKDCSGEKISLKLRETFRKNIYRDKTEELYKVYKVRSSYMTNGESKPMLALLTNKTLYLTGQKGDHTYSNQFVIPFNELDVIMVGPNAQTILISNADYEMQYLFSTGSSQTTSELITHLEMAMRRSPTKPRLPAVKELNCDDMRTLKHSILAETAVHPDEKIEHYSLIYMEDDHISPPATPCGPTKEGDLMFRSHIYNTHHPNAPTNPWEAGYFVLKGGVVYMFTDSNQRLPKRAIPLKGGLCQGCRRIPNSHRPHTFEILLKPNKAFQFAAPDEYVASEWLQSFIQSASGLYDCSEKKDPLPCSLVVTSKHLVATKEVFPGTQRGQILSCASIEDLSAIRIPLAQQSWCILEFACREVHESSGDWVVYFTNHRELCEFQEILEKLWANNNEENFPISTLPPEDKLHRRCSDACKNLEQAWQYLLPLVSE
ncbi:pleckstrin homology domain-containing family M member 2 isoform X2 [Phymastichus coffea]|uniref:pleckstrin homology domain-containing family M member 2 isoform X2 n=1 Tax=Phymastichus coffea TaxID=108790 RepID=UPI00273CB562|nr:pleckstrin homology domain-containing family M member 2 isoform X2 [Phymastichus coffea]